MRYYLGVDAGGTKTHTLIADETGRLLGCGRGGTANWEVVGLEGAYETLAHTFRDALKEAGLSASDLSAAGYGLAGVDWPSDEARLTPTIQKLGVPGPYALVNDTYVALRAGSRDGSGVVVIAGTGCTVAGRNRKGDVFRTFGRDERWGDFGAASHFVSLATRAMVFAYIGRGPQTALTDLFVQYYGAKDFLDLSEKIARETFMEPNGTLAPLVFQAADQGDAVAQDIIRKAGEEMGKTAAAIAGRLGLLDQPFDLVLAGGVIRSGSQLLYQAVLEPVRQQAPQVELVPLVSSPSAGGVLLAMDAAGQPANRDVQARLLAETSCSEKLAS